MKNRKLLFSALAGLVLFLAGCESLQTMLDAAAKIEYNSVPRVLEANGGKVSFELKGEFPAKFFAKTAILKIQPVLKCSNGEEVALEAYTVQGEEVTENFKVINSVTGGSFSHSLNIPFEERMRKAELVVRTSGTMGAESISFPEVKVADGVRATSTMVQTDPKTIFIKNEYVLKTTKKFQSDVHYKIQQSSINRKERNAEDMKAFAELLKGMSADAKKDFKSLSLVSYASPDGELKLNTKLAKNREKSATRELKRSIKRNKIELDEEKVVKKQVAEDWEGFKRELQASNINDKNLILRVLEMYTDPVKRETEIKNIAKAYEELAEDVLPKLRRTKFIIDYDLVGKDDDEILAAIKAKEDLTIEELLKAEGAVSSSTEKLKINELAIEKFPKDIRAYNNVGLINIKDGKYSKATKSLAKATEISPTNKTLFNNLAASYMLAEEFEKADEELAKAQNSSTEAYYNGAILALRKGDYGNAASNFGQWQTYNAALANYLSGNAERALDILKNLPEEGDNLYLTAVASASRNDADNMFSALLKAVQMDNKYKELAKTDIEFAQYVNDEKFQAIIQ